MRYLYFPPGGYWGDYNIVTLDMISSNLTLISCKYQFNLYEIETYGCMDENACNYNPLATIDDGSCAYQFDECGECGGNGPNHECWNGDIVCDSHSCVEQPEEFDIA